MKEAKKFRLYSKKYNLKWDFSREVNIGTCQKDKMTHIGKEGFDGQVTMMRTLADLVTEAERIVVSNDSLSAEDVISRVLAEEDDRPDFETVCRLYDLVQPQTDGRNVLHLLVKEEERTHEEK